MSKSAEIAQFVETVARQMGLELTAQAEEMEDGLRINLEGEHGVMLTRRQGEVLASLQHVVSSVYRQETLEGRRLVVDCNGFRKGKDAELKQMAIFLGEKAKSTGFAQEMGPLNPYERRIVHLAIGDIPGVSSESIGDAFEKTVIISAE